MYRSQWNVRRRADATTECFIPITSANCVNSMKRFAGARRGVAFVQIDFSIWIRLSACIPYPPPSFSLVRNRCFAGHSISIMLNIEVLCIFHFRGNVQETRVPFVTARNGAGLLIALFTISFHTTRVCVLFISRGTPRKTYPCFAKLHGLSENMRRFTLVWKLLLQVTFCISATLGCNDVRSKSELSL